MARSRPRTVAANARARRGPEWRPALPVAEKPPRLGRVLRTAAVSIALITLLGLLVLSSNVFALDALRNG